jgi:competence protein ComEC
MATSPSPLPANLEGRDLQIKGVVSSLIDRQGARSSFLIDATRLRSQTDVWSGRWRLRLHWYQAPSNLAPDQAWRLGVRVRRPRGARNPGGYDYEGWLFRHAISATGYVRSSAQDKAHSAGRHPLARVRQVISDRIAERLPPGPASGVIRALLVGDRSGIDPGMWEVFRSSGTSHLMAISGLHVGLVAAAAAALAGLLWRLSAYLCARWPAQLAGASAAVLAAGGYAALAGFSLPTQRALLMLVCAVGALLLRRNMAMSQVLALAMLAALLREPTAVSTPGFWLSFGAVALILLVLQDRSNTGVVQRWWRIQWALSLGLAPVLVAYGFPVPLTGMLANALAIPWYGFLVVPAVLSSAVLALVHESTSLWLLELAAQLIQWSFPVLERLGAWSAAMPRLPSPSAVSLGLAGFGVLLMVAPRGLPGRYLAPLLVLPLIVGTPQTDGLGAGDFRLTVLDVGQGLATVVETRGHALVFDTGPSYRSGFETGSRVVSPYLHHQGIDKLDALILSHGDVDHIGGTSGLLRLVPATQVWAGEPDARLPPRTQPCLDGYSWRWDGVVFTLRHPLGAGQAQGNDASCVVKVENARDSVLLTGDIEVAAERRLVRRHAQWLDVGVVVAPHHGSRTSSSREFVEATRPSYVVYSAGYRNRFGFPAPDVTNRWRVVGAAALNTADGGAIQIEVTADAGLRRPVAFRLRERRYWHARE